MNADNVTSAKRFKNQRRWWAKSVPTAYVVDAVLLDRTCRMEVLL